MCRYLVRLETMAEVSEGEEFWRRRGKEGSTTTASSKLPTLAPRLPAAAAPKLPTLAPRLPTLTPSGLIPLFHCPIEMGLELLKKRELSSYLTAVVGISLCCCILKTLLMYPHVGNCTMQCCGAATFLGGSGSPRSRSRLRPIWVGSGSRHKRRLQSAPY